MNYLLQPIIQIEDSNGKPLVGGKVYVYKHGITPPVLADTYSDFSSHLNTNPIILDSLGHCTIIAEADTLYDVIIKDSNDLLQFSIVNASVIGGSGDITIENPPVEVKAGNGLKVDKTTLLDGTIQYKVSNNATNPTDKGDANFVLGKDNYAEGDYNLVQGENNVTYGKSNTIFGYNIKHNQAPLGNDYNLINGHSHETNGKFQYNIVNGYGLHVDNDNDSYVTNNAIFCSTCNITNADISDSFITGDYTTITNVYIHSGNIQGCSNSIIGKNGQKSGVSYPVVLGYSNKLIHDTDSTHGPSNNTVIGGYNEDHYGYSTILGYSNKTYDYGNYIFGQDNTSNGSYTWILGSRNDVKNAYGTHILGDYNIVDYTTQDYNSNNVTIIGNGLVNRSNNNTGNGKIVIGKHNEDNPDAFLEIAKGDDLSNPKNMLEIRHDDTIFYRYNNEMVQLKPTTDNLVMVSVEAGQPEYKTFDEMLELITQGKYLVLVSGIPGAAFFFPVKSVSNDSIDFDGYDRIVSYKNDNTTEIIERNMVCVVDNVTERLSQSFENIKKCLDDNGSVVVKLDIVGYNMYALLRANAVTQDFILFSSTYIPNESTTPHTLTLKLNSDESIEFSEG